MNLTILPLKRSTESDDLLLKIHYENILTKAALFAIRHGFDDLIVRPLIIKAMDAAPSKKVLHIFKSDIARTMHAKSLCAFAAQAAMEAQTTYGRKRAYRQEVFHKSARSRFR